MVTGPSLETKSATMGIKLLMMAAQTVKLKSFMNVKENHQFASAYVEINILNLLLAKNVTMETPILLMVA